MQALKVLDNEGVVDLVISDVMMPRIDGLELCKRIKNDPAYSHIPVILLSAKVDQSVKIKGFEQGADVYIEKPFSMDQLKAQIGSAIENRMRLRTILSVRRCNTSGRTTAAATSSSSTS